MATIDVHNAFILKNNVLRTLLHKGTGLTLKLFSKDKSGGRKYILELTSGWYHYERKHPEKGTVEEKLKIVETEDVTQAIINKTWGCDIVADDESFIRYTLNAKSPMNPITHEWSMTANPSSTDKSDITPIS
jgi:hypothetical protein